MPDSELGAIMGVKIGNCNLEYGLMLAPMAGFSDRAMRVVCHECGAEYSVSEMISAKAVVYGDRKTFALAKIEKDEGPVGIQIFGSEPDIMAKAADILEHGTGDTESTKPHSIDINMGCPVNKIFKNGEGSALMKSPELIYRIVRAVKGAISIPLTVKLRLGVDLSNINVTECALAAEEAGACLITVHGRTRAEMYSGEVHIEEIKKVKDSLQIPVIANGDIASYNDAEKMLRLTGCDGVAIGRAAVGNPFIFDEIRHGVEGREYTSPSLSERVNVALKQLRLALLDKGEKIAVPEARKQIALYLKDFRGAAKVRAEINRAVTYSEVEKILLAVLEADNS